MTSVDFFAMTDLEHQAKLVGMMSALYAEDEATSPVDHAHFPFSVQFLVANPSRGRVVLFSEGGTICGYALLIPYWSNEFGGILLFVDEIFVAPEARSRGIGSSFFRHLDRTRPFDAVALALEISPDNVRARGLYESLGFSYRRNSVFTHLFGHAPKQRD
jgi:ribosomal protein S18 acetylase RimI-like enzyme